MHIYIYNRVKCLTLNSSIFLLIKLKRNHDVLYLLLFYCIIIKRHRAENAVQMIEHKAFAHMKPEFNLHHRPLSSTTPHGPSDPLLQTNTSGRGPTIRYTNK